MVRLPTLDITTFPLTPVDMRKVEAVEMSRGSADANARVLRSIVRELTAIECAFDHGISRFLGDYGGAFDEVVTAGIDREAVRA